MNILRNICTLLFFLSSGLGVGHATEKTLLILPFDVATDKKQYQGMGEGISEIVATCFTAHSEWNVLDRRDLGRLIDELGLAYETDIASESVAKIGHLASANYVLRGSFTVEKETLNIEMFLYEVESTRLMSAGGSYGSLSSLVKDCPKIFHQITSALREKVSLPPSPRQTETNPEISRLMIEGLGFYHNGEFWKAFPAFLKVLEEDPKHGIAKFWLGRSYLESGMNDLARISLEEFIHQFPNHRKFSEAQHLLKGIK
jgi:TolB-like protein